MTQTLAPRTVRDSYRVLAGFMREAVRQGLIRESPCYSIILPRMPRPEPRFLAPEQVERLAAVIDARYGQGACVFARASDILPTPCVSFSPPKHKPAACGWSRRSVETYPLGLMVTRTST